MQTSVSDDATRAALQEHLRRLTHDLGKYVAFQARWLPADAPHAEQLDVLRADVLTTRRGRDGVMDAGEVWASLRPELVGERPLFGGGKVDLRGEPVFDRLDGAVDELSRLLPALRVEVVDAATVARARALAIEVSEGCRALLRRFRGDG